MGSRMVCLECGGVIEDETGHCDCIPYDAPPEVREHWEAEARRACARPRTPAVTAEPATVYKGGGRRYFTRRAAYRAAAKARAFELRPCDCSPAEYDTGCPGDVCELHGMDRDHFCRVVHRLADILQAQDRKHGGGS